MSAENAKEDCRFPFCGLFFEIFFFVIYAAKGFRHHRRNLPATFRLRAGSPVRYHRCTCYEESLSAPNSCLSRQGRSFCTLSGVEGTSELRNRKS
jgi:hypothetical protein